MSTDNERMSYQLIDGTVTCSSNGVVHPLYDLAHEQQDKLIALAYLGVKSYVLQIASMRKTMTGTKLDKVKTAAAELRNKRADEMFRKGRAAAPKYPKRDRIAALASIKRCTISALTEALKQIPSERADELLNSDEVLAVLKDQEILARVLDLNQV